jgi:hypothetical protein
MISLADQLDNAWGVAGRVQGTYDNTVTRERQSEMNRATSCWCVKLQSLDEFFT